MAEEALDRTHNGRYHAVKGSVVWETKENMWGIVAGVACSSYPDRPDVQTIGVDMTDPGMRAMTNEEEWTRAVFPGRPDLIFAAGDKVVWVEVKTNWDDFDGSMRSKRLAREVKTALSLADIVVVAVPRVLPVFLDVWESYQLELLRLQTQGVLVVPWSTSFQYWDDIRSVLSSTSNQRRALAGTDTRKPRSTALAGFPGVGAKTEAKLLAAFGDVHSAVAAYLQWDQVLGKKQALRIETVCQTQTGGT